MTSDLEVKSDAYSVVREHLSNGRSEKLLGEQPDHRIRATAIVENNKLVPGENRLVTLQTTTLGYKFEIKEHYLLFCSIQDVVAKQ